MELASHAGWPVLAPALTIARKAVGTQKMPIYVVIPSQEPLDEEIRALVPQEESYEMESVGYAQ